MDRRIVAITVTYNSASALPGLLDSLAAGSGPDGPARVIVVDNASSDDSVALARHHPVNAEVALMGRNAGYAAAINAGASLAGLDEDLLILNPDIRLRAGAIAELRQALEDFGAGVAVPRMLHEDGTLARSLRREPSVLTAWSEALLGGAIAARVGLGETVADDTLYDHGGEAEWATGAALLISAAARRVVGSWDESFFLYSEEVDYMRRARAAGFAVRYVPGAIVEHKGGAYQRDPFLSALMTTNRIRDFRRHHGGLETAAFRLGLIVGSAMRAGLGPGHRAALKAALMAGSSRLPAATPARML